MNGKSNVTSTTDRHKAPLVSVIIPTYNRARYVVAAVESALAQTYPHREIIVVDDGSTDDTRQVLEPFSGQITYLYKANEGTAAAARNLAMRHAQGQYIALLDSDDIWLPRKLELQMAYVQAHPEVGLVSGQVGIIDADGAILEPGPRYLWQKAGPVRLEDIVLRSPLHASTLLVRRSLMNAALPFDPRFRICEDWHLCLTVAAQAPVGFVDEVIAYLRSHDSASTFALADGPEIARRLDHRLTVIEEVFPRFDPVRYDVAKLKAQAIANELARTAVPNYACGEHELAREQLAQAVALDPVTWRDGSNLADLVHNYAVLIAKARGFPQAEAFLEAVFAHLPTALQGVGHLRRNALGDAHIELGFLARQMGRSDLVRRHMLLGLRHKPKWARNRGVLSLLGRSLLAGSS